MRREYEVGRGCLGVEDGIGIYEPIKRSAISKTEFPRINLRLDKMTICFHYGMAANLAE
jgi:hypothetical protein